MLKANWWKYLGAALILYSIIAGLYIPLGAGIMEVTPSELKQGQSNTILITGKSTNFSAQQNSLKVWIKQGENIICSQKLLVNSNDKVAVIFEVPTLDIKAPLNLVINNDEDGTIVMSNAFWFNASENGERFTKFGTCDTKVTNTEANETSFPFLKILFQTIRNLFYHVPMWFSMIAVLIGGMVYSIVYLKSGMKEHDIVATQLTGVAMLLGVMGILTGMLWARFTWGQPWPNDPKLNSVAIGMLMYSAYFILRGAIDDEEKKARIAAVTNVFFFPIFIVLIFVLPRLTSSLHPGNGGNPGFGSYDLDATMRMVFYPAVLGWILFAYWIANLKIRVKKLEALNDDED